MCAVGTFLVIWAGCVLRRCALQTGTTLMDYCHPISEPIVKCLVFLDLGCHGFLRTTIDTRVLSAGRRTRRNYRSNRDSSPATAIAASASQVHPARPCVPPAYCRCANCRNQAITLKTLEQRLSFFRRSKPKLQSQVNIKREMRP